MKEGNMAIARKKAPRGDRLQLTIKDFGRTVRISAPRGKAVVSKDRKTVTIRYDDGPTRK
jgi:hypothetical protein